jgi:hypothetical protein
LGLALEPGEDRPTRRVDERRKGPVELVAIVHHVANYLSVSLPLATTGATRRHRPDNHDRAAVASDRRPVYLGMDLGSRLR